MEATVSQEPKKTVGTPFDLAAQGRRRDDTHFSATDCKRLNPYVKAGLVALLDVMTAVQKRTPEYPGQRFSVSEVLADGNTAAVNADLVYSKPKPGEGDLKQDHSTSAGVTRPRCTGVSRRQFSQTRPRRPTQYGAGCGP